MVPLLRLNDYEDLPPELAGLHCPDFRAGRPLDQALDELLRVLSDPVPALGPLQGEVPGVPPHYQPRTSDMTRLAAEVMRGRNDPITVTGSQRITVLHGMGGSGKSVMAAALARSTATRQAFDDGIIWLAPDAETRPTQLLRGLGELLGGDTQAWHSASDCADGVRDLLSVRRLLVVIDNAASGAGGRPGRPGPADGAACGSALGGTNDFAARLSRHGTGPDRATAGYG